MTTVHNIKRHPRGADTVYIGRSGSLKQIVMAPDVPPWFPGWLGNPYQITMFRTRRQAIELFQNDFFCRVATDQEFADAVLSLYGKKLLCFCKPFPCHGDVIADWINSHYA